MLVPPHASLYDALQPLRRDLKHLENGIEIETWKETEGRKTMTMRGAISCLIADHPQACENTRHMGNMAKKNCRTCHVDKSERTVWDPIILDHSFTRRRLQTDVICRQMTAESSLPHLTATDRNGIATKYGIRCSPCLFTGLDIDPHLQSFPDVEHMVDLGLLRVLLSFMISQLTEKEKKELQERLDCFQYPRGWSRLTVKLIDSKGQLKQPMSCMRKVAALSFVLFEGLAAPELIDLLYQLLHLRSLLLRHNQNNESTEKVSVHISFQFFFFKLCQRKFYCLVREQNLWYRT